MPPDPARIALIGQRGHIHIALDDIKKSPGTEIVGVCGGDPDTPADAVAASCERVLGHAPRTFAGDFRAMLDAVKPDVLVVCGPFETHAAMTREAIRREIHVFCEKPVATTLDDLVALAAAHRKHPAAHIAQMCGPHYDAGLWSATRRLDQIGPVRLLSAQKSYKLGRRDPSFTRRETAAGLIPWVGIHAISWLYHFAGRQPFTSVSAFHSTAGNRDHGELEASAACLFTFANALPATLTADYLRPECRDIPHGDDRLRVMGDTGCLEVLNNVCHHLSADGAQTAAEPPPLGLFADFLRLIDGQPANILADDDALRVTQAALLAREAADTHTTLTIPELPRT